MEPRRYDVWLVRFAPESLPDAASGLQRVFGIDQGAAERVLLALPFLAKRGAEREQAERYAAALAEIGAEVRAEVRLKTLGVEHSVDAPADDAAVSAPARRKKAMPKSAKLVLGGAVAVTLIAVVGTILMVRVALEVAENPQVIAPAGASSEPAQLSERELSRTQEAREFLYDEHCRVWSEDLSREQLESWIDRLYAAGATRVAFAGISEMEEIRVSATLVAELPDSGFRRTRVLETWNEVVARMPDGYRIADRGQAHLFIDLD